MAVFLDWPTEAKKSGLSNNGIGCPKKAVPSGLRQTVWVAIPPQPAPHIVDQTFLVSRGSWSKRGVGTFIFPLFIPTEASAMAINTLIKKLVQL